MNNMCGMIHKSKSIEKGIDMQQPLTTKQERVMNYIREFTLKKSFPPTVREICESLGIRSTSTVHAHLQTLEEKGYIRRDPTKPRAMEILDESFQDLPEISSIPLIGHVAAGEPIIADERIESYFPVPANHLPSGQCFMLKVHGESMINVGIMDGDYVMVNQQSTARNGDIVVALLEDSATVKTFYREKDHIRLQPENDALEPIICHDNVSILGRVFGSYRFIN